MTEDGNYILTIELDGKKRKYEVQNVGSREEAFDKFSNEALFEDDIVIEECEDIHEVTGVV